MEKFIEKTRNKIMIIMLLSVAFSCAMVLARMSYTGVITYVFLIWNLFLAWLPYIFSKIISRNHHRIKSRLILAIFIGIWLLFLPNAPYIMTDLFHLKPRTSIPLWYDLILIVSFAWNGMLMGIISIYRIQKVIETRSGNFISWLFTIGAIFLCSFGIYLGRYERWNSWDLISNPVALSKDILGQILHPVSNAHTIAITVTFSAFLLLIYITLKIMLSGHNKQDNDF